MRISYRLQPAAVLLSLVALAAAAFGQGSLTPTGTPGPTMKTLDQVEARTPIPGGMLTASYTISASGSYYLTGNLIVASGSNGAFDAVQIQADQVTLDLNGFTISCTGTAAASASAVLINGARTNVTVRNGHIQSTSTLSGVTFSNTGFYNGVFASSSARNLRVQGVSVQGTQRGIYLSLTDNSGTATDCKVNVASSGGITAAIVKGCTAVACGSTAITGLVVSDCYGVSTGGSGISGDTVTNCEGAAAGTAAGVNGTTVSNCSGSNTYNINSGGPGISGVTITNCRGTSIAGVGVSASIANACTGATVSGTGISATIGVACIGTATGGGAATSITNKYNMP